MHFSARRHIHTNEAVRHASFTGATPRACARAADYREDWWSAATDEAESATRLNGGDIYGVDLEFYYDTSRTYLHGA